MAFPNLTPTSRSFQPGDFPVKTFKAQNGAEIRFRYGDKCTNLKLSLSYANITDAQADQFLSFYYNTAVGTFKTFSLSANALGGTSGNTNFQNGATTGTQYRFEGPPQLTQVRPGISTVTVNLIGVF